jgi:glycosyltransferase involved in cell wall biosynthesis
MITNSTTSNYDLIEVTNELPVNRLGGVGSVIENLVSGFDALGVHVLWYLVDHSYREYEINYILKKYPNVAIGSYNGLNIFDAPVVHLHTYNNNPAIFTYLKNKKVIYTIHSLLICEALSNDVDMSYGIKQQENMIAACDEIVLVSKAELESYYQYNYHTLNSNVRVIHNGLRHINRPKTDGIRKKTIGFCGRLVPRKRPEYVHMLLTEDDFRDCSVMIAGRGFSPYAKNILKQNNLNNRVHYLGWCGGSRLESFYDALDVLAIPSIYEPFGMVALEAVACGVPIVCNPIGGLVEILSDNAFYSAGKTYQTFRNAMREWLKADTRVIHAKTWGAYKRFNDNFTDIKMAHKYMDLISQFYRV